ncbi:MAG: (Na+)-NQR maturation NqrM [SAR86 cluster bacterium]|jgi:uncharacterized protein|nr:(Na+)-NQR maturation NqrM [SAR86 cluster bacterium]
MTTLILTFIFLVILVALMSVGVLFGRQPISGSCGGMKSIEGQINCDLCGGDKSKCIE